ncbi:hypothetical protein RI543_004824 [Arxiozyma heterogenica]|uniref:Uncharacterized protein n=1 Tax=Arxiozyma heterogenica TaxID=278026 RepID=A0AAN7WLF2_9SACH|nr:hypothetical protein RI543_004824 [Kazachstania heterogenica]
MSINIATIKINTSIFASMSQDRLKYDTTYTITLVNGDSSSSSEVVDIVTPSSSTLYTTAYNHLRGKNTTA